MIARIENAWLRRGIIIVLAIPLTLAAIIMGMGAAAIEDGQQMARSIARVWKGCA